MNDYTEDSRLGAAITLMLGAIVEFRRQGFDPREMADEIEKQCLKPGGKFYNEERAKLCRP